MIWLPHMLIAFVTSLVLTGLLSRYRGRYALLDKPNARSLHSELTPRAGGLAILAGLAAGFLSIPVALTDFIPGSAWAISALVLVAGISLADDVWGLPAWVRLPVHLIAASMLVLSGSFLLCQLDVLPGLHLQLPAWLYLSFSVLLTAWLINLYNFMDGMDGLAAGMAVIGFATFALLGWAGHNPVFAVSALLVAVASAGFLVFNFPPARIFMGDVGSSSLGLLVAVFVLWADRHGIFPLWLGLLVFSPFIVDATWTLIRRALRGRRPWAAHREHFYQRLVQSGWSHRRTTLWAYALMLKSGLLSLLAFWSGSARVGGLLMGWMAVVYLAIIAYVNARERRPLSKVEEA